MAYSELIKNFEKVRSYMREFYAYGFKGRDEIGSRSARVYDDEYRRVKAWLEGYMDAYYNASGKKVFLSIDSRAVFHNPLYAAFRAKSFTDMDITLHFYLLDILSDGPATVKDCLAQLLDRYPAEAGAAFPDESTVRNKLKEYERMGILESRKEGRTLLYALRRETVDIAAWKDAIYFFSETNPLGVIGSYFPQDITPPFEFKHQYFLGALDSEVFYDLCACMREKRGVELTTFSRHRKQEFHHIMYPARFYLSTQTGRQYLLAFHYRYKRPMFFRLDCIRKVKALGVEKHVEKYEAFWQSFDPCLWGVSEGDHTLDHLEMLIHVEPDEFFIVERLQREKRHGKVEQVDTSTWRFSADVYDATELLPWIRTFIGRIDALTCSNAFVVQRFEDDMRALNRMYGGEADAVQ